MKELEMLLKVVAGLAFVVLLVINKNAYAGEMAGSWIRETRECIRGAGSCTGAMQADTVRS